MISNRKIRKKWKAYRPAHLIIQVFCERNRQTEKKRKPGRNKLRKKRNREREREKEEGERERVTVSIIRVFKCFYKIAML